MIDTIIFDLGGVVLNRGIWFFREWLVETYGVTNEDTINIFIKKYYKQYFSGKISEEEFWKNSLSDLSIDAEWKKLRSKLLSFFKPNKGMFELIDFLRNSGYKIALLSDQTNEWWLVLDNQHSISSHFEKCIISSEVGFHKPQPEIYNLTLNKLKSQPETSLFIDDLEQNLTPANKIGMKTILYQDTSQLKKEMATFGIKIE